MFHYPCTALIAAIKFYHRVGKFFAVGVVAEPQGRYGVSLRPPHHALLGADVHG